jgi:mRNA interferase YafQ
MTAKCSAAGKRAPPPRAADYAKSFLKEMLLWIANEGPLGPAWPDHPLGGDWAGHRECHIGGNFLLTYKVDDWSTLGLIVFVRAGTRADPFE